MKEILEVYANGRAYLQIPDGGSPKCADCCFCVGETGCCKPNDIAEPEDDPLNSNYGECKSNYYKEVKVDIGKDTAQRALAVLRSFCHHVCSRNDNRCRICAARHVIVELSCQLGLEISDEEKKKFCNEPNS